MTLRLLALSAVAACTAFAGSALAQSQPYEQIRPESQGWTVDLGAGVLYRNDSNGDTGSKTTVAPWISANYRDIVYLTPIDGLGWNAIKTDDFRAGLQLRPRFSADDIEGLTLDSPGFGADLAAYAYKRLPGNVVVGGRISRDVSDVSEGTEYYASVGHQRVTPVGLLNASVYVRGGDSKLADPEERSRMARAQMRRATRPITVYSGSMPLLKKNDRLGAKSSIFMPRAR